MPMGHGMSCPYRLTLTPGPLSLWAYYMIVFVEWGCHPELEGVKAKQLNPPTPFTKGGYKCSPSPKEGYGYSHLPKGDQ
jgi:hypothetical protein